MNPHRHIDTRAVHEGREDLPDMGVHAAPLDLSTTYPSRDSRGGGNRLEALASGDKPGPSPVYARVGNPTVARFEDALANLEGCQSAVAFASGMAALTACLLASVAAGKPHVVAIRPLYGTSDSVLNSGLLGTTVTWTTADRVGQSLRPDTGLVIVETPGNPTLAEHDLAAVCGQAGGVPVLVDNTFATPVLQRPAEHGASLVLHSATKFLGGHGDVMGGVVACSEELARTLRPVRGATGSVLHPLAGYLLLRGLATLPLRVRQASCTAATLARRLTGHPAVTAVHYPGLRPRRPRHQMASGGALLAFETAGDPHDVVERLRLITPAVSLGSVDSLIEHPASLTHHGMDPHDRAATGISESLLRMSVGLEYADDLWDDLNQALTSGR